MDGWMDGWMDVVDVEICCLKKNIYIYNIYIYTGYIPISCQVFDLTYISKYLKDEENAY